MIVMENSSEDQSKPEAEVNSAIFHSIANQKDAFFKSQQRNEPDLTVEEKIQIVETVFHSDPSRFLQRYGMYLSDTQLDQLELQFSKDCDQVADINIQINDLRQRLHARNITVKNRRYHALNELLAQGTYFSNSEMQSRAPYLFEQMVGQYMNQKERQKLSEESSQLNNDKPATFSSFLLDQIESSHLQCRYIVQQFTEEQGEEEEEEEKEEEDGENDSDDDSKDNEDNESSNITEHDKKQLEKEFLNQMIHNFLSGKDKEHFDYSKTDNNDQFDLSNEFERDQEDRYFEND